MEDAEKVPKEIEVAKEMIEKLEKAFNELDSCRESSMPNKTRWEDIIEHFDKLEKSLKEKLKEVEEKEKTLEEKQSAACKLVSEREVAVVTKEHASLNYLQELKDNAVSAIAEVRKNCKAPTPVVVDVKGSKDNKVSTSIIKESTASTAPGENLPNKKLGDLAEAISSEVRLHAQLKELCAQMDAKGLLKILSDNRKVLATIGEVLSNALKIATQPARLVLDSVEGFYPPDPSYSQGSQDNALQAQRRSCHVILEAAFPLLGMAEPAHNQPVSSEIKQQARTIADEWKAKLAGVDIDASNGYSLEAAAFLQLIATFRIAEEFHEDELCKLVLAVSRRKQAPELCRSLGITHRMPGVVDTLVKSGRQIDAVHFAYAFQLTESFPPVLLLNEYLNNVRGNTQENNDSTTEAEKKEANNKELSALRAVMKCIEGYKLHEDYPLDPLKERVAQLEKTRNDKKRTGQAARTQAKKPRASGGYAPRKPAALADNRQVPPLVPIYNERPIYPSTAKRYSERYAYAKPTAYEAPYSQSTVASHVPYSQASASVSHAPYSQQPNVQRHYQYLEERVPPPAPYSSSSSSYTNYGASAYGSYGATGYQSSAAATNYGSYMGTGVQSASPNYGSYVGAGGQPPHQSSYM